MKPPPKIKLARRLRWLASHMAQTAADMDYYGGFAEWAQHSKEMLGASVITRQWAYEIELEALAEKGKA